MCANPTTTLAVSIVNPFLNVCGREGIGGGGLHKSILPCVCDLVHKLYILIEQTETDHSQVSASTSSKEEPPISTRPHDRTSQRDASVQTCLPSQHTDIHSAYHRPPLGGQYCRDYLTPTPILPHVLSAGTLEGTCMCTVNIHMYCGLIKH